MILECQAEPTTYICCNKVWKQKQHYRYHMMSKHNMVVPYKFTRDKKRKPEMELLEIDSDDEEVKVEPYSR